MYAWIPCQTDAGSTQVRPCFSYDPRLVVTQSQESPEFPFHYRHSSRLLSVCHWIGAADSGLVRVDAQPAVQQLRHNLIKKPQKNIILTQRYGALGLVWCGVVQCGGVV